MAVVGEKFAVWSVDALEKTFREARPTDGGDVVEIDACRGEVVSGQVAVRAGAALADLHVQVRDLKHEGNGATDVDVRTRFVGFVPVTKNTPDTPEEELICQAPCLVPDPLLMEKVISLEPEQTQPVWLTVSVPEDAAPGKYIGVMNVSGDGEEVAIPLRLTVHPVTLPAERNLFVTNWTNIGNFARFFGTERYTERFWSVIDSFARNMGEHRQSVILCPTEMIRIAEEENGRLTFDFTDWDRWVETFDRHGCAKLIEGGHLGRRGEGKWLTPWFEWRKFPVKRRAGATGEVDPEQVIKQLVAALYAHLKERGWFDRFVMHVVDEPAEHTEEDYRKKAALIRGLMPGVRFLEAMSLPDARGLLDLLVPQLSHFHERLDEYLKLRDETGVEIWHYTCMYPTGRYPNRFLDFSLLKTRVLHWINWRYGLTGYLHWGLNFWAKDPFRQDRIDHPEEDLPPGDWWIVYPGEDGPIDSLRWEHMREGIQDYELLRLLGERGPEGLADDICRRLVPDPVSYARTAAELRAARRDVIAALST